MARPRIYPIGQEPSEAERKRVMRARLAERGGKIINVALESDDLDALERIRDRLDLASDREAISAAIRALDDFSRKSKRGA
jgi:hypothetical protein